LCGRVLRYVSTVFHGSHKMWTAAVNLSASIAPAPFEPDTGETRSTSMSTTGNRASMSLAQATAATGMVKSSILRAIKCGRISAVRDDLGRWLIEPVELHRVFPPPVAEQRCKGDAAAHGAPGGNVAAMAELRMRAELAELQLCDLKAALNDMKKQRDAWRDQAIRLRRSPQRGRNGSRGRDDDDADVC
jgi:hypothetical protein